MESGLSGDQRVAIVECIENYIGDWACPDPYDAADFIAARVLEITRAPSDAALVEALEPFARAYERWADGGNLKGWQAERMKQSVDAHRYCVAFEALAAAKGQP